MEANAIQETLSPLALPSRRYVLSLGSIEPRKNLPRLLEAWGKILPTLPEDVWLVVAGGRNARVFAAAETAEKLGVRSEELEAGDGGSSPQRHPDSNSYALGIGTGYTTSDGFTTEAGEGSGGTGDPQISQISQINDGGTSTNNEQRTTNSGGDPSRRAGINFGGKDDEFHTEVAEGSG
ncbi:Glycosyl transferase, group 1 domain protein, partial [mine drainage metagenome]